MLINLGYINGIKTARAKDVAVAKKFCPVHMNKQPYLIRSEIHIINLYLILQYLNLFSVTIITYFIFFCYKLIL